ncbi:ornithine cyclodeaminase family protein [Maritalea sp.]|uniref:ornithine cyclodeaminase family protein n=1 Tax=Maritalea sp. TaxID=2003361 RepID=UPI003EFAA457
MHIPFISIEDVDAKLSWSDVADAIYAGHQNAKARLGDLALERGEQSMLNRAAWIDGLGLALKSVTIYPSNAQRTPPMPTIEAVVVLFDDETGAIKALIDGQLVTKWKTAGDSVLGARLLARKNAKCLLVVGSGIVAASLVDAYREVFPELETIKIWSRNLENAKALADHKNCEVATDLAVALGEADIVTSATMARSPVILGEWVQAGTHVDLIGAFRLDMREADDELLRKGRLFVDSRETTIHDIGELAIPLADGVISESDVLADYYDFAQSKDVGRKTDDEITVFKNGGGAHLDLMVANLIYEKWSA